MNRRQWIGSVSGLVCLAGSGLPVLGLAAVSTERVMIVLTNTARVPGSDRPTGVWASEYTDPYQVFTRAGYEVHVYTPRGGVAPIDPRSGSADRVKAIPSAWDKMQSTRPLAQARLDDYAAVFLAGGHGTMWDFRDAPALKAIVEGAFLRELPLGAVCHGPAGLLSSASTPKSTTSWPCPTFA